MKTITLPANTLEIMVGIIGVLILFNLAQLVLWRQTAARVRRLTRLLRVGDRDSLDEFIEASRAELDQIGRRLDDIAAWQRRTDEILSRCARTPVLLRYRAFEGVGGDQSYSCAVLDGRGDGAVLTSLYAPNCTYSYGKPVRGGLSEYALSEEEQKALDLVLNDRRQEK